MTGYSTRKVSSTQAKSKESKLEKRNKGSPAKETRKVNASGKKTLRVKPETNVSRVTTRSKGIIKKQRDDSVKTDKSVTEEKGGIITRGKKLHKNIKKVAEEVVTRGKSSRSKNEIVRKIDKSATSSRQMSLKESFLKQSMTRRLRSADASKNNELSPTKQIKSKLPIYKRILPENSANNGSEIYEFKFDVNDSKEKLSKKRKARLASKAKQTTKKQKNVFKKPKVQKTKFEKGEPAGNQPKEVTGKKPTEALEKIVSIKLPEKNVINDADLQKESDVQFSLPEEVNVEPIVNKEDTNMNKEEVPFTKPAVVSVHNLTNQRIKIVENTPVSRVDNFMPFRPTNIFNNKFATAQKSLLNHSLFDKSLSPITKVMDNFDLGSPWRVSSLFTFSQVRNAFQSTPQNKVYDVVSKKLIRAGNSESRSFGNLTKLKDTSQTNYENISMEGWKNTNTPKKTNLTSSRKFGTEITNINQSVVNSPLEETRERIVIESENVQPVNVTNTSLTNIPPSDDQENSRESPRKVHHIKKGVMSIKSRSPLKALSNIQTNKLQKNTVNILKSIEQKENILQSIEQKENILQSNEQKENAVAPKMKSVKGISVRYNEQENVDPRFESLGLVKRRILTQIIDQKENIEPQPGPSGLQKFKVLTENYDQERNRSSEGRLIDDSQKSLKSTENEQKENIEPQPGPSGLQKFKVLTENYEQERNRSSEGKLIDDSQKSLKSTENEQKENIEPQPGPSGLQKFKVLTENYEQERNRISEGRLIDDSLKSLKSTENDEQKENVDPQPGPSGLQKRTLNESRVLMQSNLNSFLNIMDMPENASIKTPHGIFDDINVKPISNKSVRKQDTSKIELVDAFGFSDEETNENVPSIMDLTADENKEESVLNPNVKPFARISVNEIKNTLIPSRQKRGVQARVNKKLAKLETKKSPVKGKKISPIDISNFSDTFDMLSETDEISESHTSEVPLFADLEPSHFTQPARHSYKRKRTDKYIFLEESEAEEKEVVEVKRRKHEKMKKEDQTRVLEWVEKINKTFEEIDEYDLIVE